jgi:hypothetical protein
MLDLSNDSYKDNSGGASPNFTPMTTQQAKQKAYNLYVNRVPPTLEKAVDYLSVGGVMTAAQLGFTSRSFRNHAKTRVADRLPYETDEIAQRFDEYSLPLPDDRESLSLYALGPVGIEMAKMRYEIDPPTGYIAYTLDRIMHDVVVNELVLRIGKLAKIHGWTPIWVGEQEAALYKENHQILKPDALVRLHKDDQERLYLIEYHNEDKSTRALEKVQIYERAYNSDLWRQIWNTDEFPLVLASFRNPVVGRGYKDGVEDRNSVHCQFCGRSLSSILSDLDEWYNFTVGKRERVWPWSEQE